MARNGCGSTWSSGTPGAGLSHARVGALLNMLPQAERDHEYPDVVGGGGRDFGDVPDVRDDCEPRSSSRDDDSGRADSDGPPGGEQGGSEEEGEEVAAEVSSSAPPSSASTAEDDDDGDGTPRACSSPHLDDARENVAPYLAKVPSMLFLGDRAFDALKSNDLRSAFRLVNEGLQVPQIGLHSLDLLLCRAHVFSRWHEDESALNDLNFLLGPPGCDETRFQGDAEFDDIAADGHVLRAHVLYRSKRYRESLSDCDQVVASEPDDPLCLVRILGKRMRCRMRLSLLELALEDGALGASLCHKLSPEKDPWVFDLNTTECLKCLHRPKEALAVARELLLRGESLPRNAVLPLIEFFFSVREDAVVVKLAQHALLQDAPSERVLALQVNAYVRQKLWDDALRSLEVALLICSEPIRVARLHSVRVMVLFRKYWRTHDASFLQRAILDIRAALPSQPLFLKAKVKVSMVCVSAFMGDFGEAQSRLESWTAKNDRFRRIRLAVNVMARTKAIANSGGKIAIVRSLLEPVVSMARRWSRGKDESLGVPLVLGTLLWLIRDEGAEGVLERITARRDSVNAPFALGMLAVARASTKPKRALATLESLLLDKLSPDASFPLVQLRLAALSLRAKISRELAMMEPDAGTSHYLSVAAADEQALKSMEGRVEPWTAFEELEIVFGTIPGIVILKQFEPPD